MKREQHIQPAPQSIKPSLCFCGVDYALPHQCRWRHTVSASHGPPHANTAQTQTKLQAHSATQRKRIIITGSLPSRRRKQKAGVLGPLARDNHFKLKGMPVDVFHPEPFNAYPIPTIGVVHRMVEYYLRVWAPSQGKPFAFEGHPNPYVSLLWPYALQDAVIFEGLITMCRATWLLESGQNISHDRAFNYHFNNSRHALQRRLDNPSLCHDDTTLLAVLTITTIDYTLGQHAMAEQYLQNMRLLVAARGGTRYDTDWDKFLTASVTAFDMLWSFILSSSQQLQDSPVSPDGDQPSEMLRNAIPIYAQHPFPPEYTASLSRIPKGFSNLAVEGLLSMQCVSIIERMPFNWANSDAPASPRPAANIQVILTDILKLATLTTHKMEHILLYGLVAYCLPLQYGTPLPVSCTRILQTCVDEYMKFNFREHEEKTDGKCLLWIAVVMSSCLAVCAEEDLRNAPVLERILTRFPQARSWDNVENILRTFMWHNLLAPQWMATWQSVMSRRTIVATDAGISPQTFSPINMVNGSPGSIPSTASKVQSTSPVPTLPTPTPKSHDRPGMKVSSLLSDD